MVLCDMETERTFLGTQMLHIRYVAVDLHTALFINSENYTILP